MSTTPEKQSQTSTFSVSKAIQQLQTELESALDISFSLLIKEETQEAKWRILGGDNNDGTTDFPTYFTPEQDAILHLSLEKNRPYLVPASPTSTQIPIVVPCALLDSTESSVPSAFLIGWAEKHAESLTLHLTTTLVNLHLEKQKNGSLTNLNNNYAAQVSHDFEELYWLRNLAQNVEYCDADQDLKKVADRVLPDLCNVIQATSLVFLQCDGSPFYIAGEQNVDLNMCNAILTEFKEEAFVHPVIHNSQFHAGKFNTLFEKKSFVLLPFSKGSFHAGWLVAFKKGAENDSLSLAEEHVINPNTFGTFDVSLISTAGILLANQAHNSELFSQQNDLLVGVVRSMINAIDAKDPYTCGHSDRVALLSKRIAQQLRFNDEYCEKIYMSGLLHDVGKIGIPDEVLCKKGRLTEEEYEIIKTHPEIGHSILKHLKPLQYVLPGVLHHHENYDGTGYPMQLVKDNIPLEGRIIAVADAYDAMTSSRPYRSAMPFEKAEAILIENSGTQWDPRIVKAFFAALSDVHRICERTVQDTKGLFTTKEGTEEQAWDDDSIHSAVSLTNH